MANAAAWFRRDFFRGATRCAAALIVLTTSLVETDLLASAEGSVDVVVMTTTDFQQRMTPEEFATWGPTLAVASPAEVDAALAAIGLAATSDEVTRIVATTTDAIHVVDFVMAPTSGELTYSTVSRATGVVSQLTHATATIDGYFVRTLATAPGITSEGASRMALASCAACTIGTGLVGLAGGAARGTGFGCFLGAVAMSFGGDLICSSACSQTSEPTPYMAPTVWGCTSKKCHLGAETKDGRSALSSIQSQIYWQGGPNPTSSIRTWPLGSVSDVPIRHDKQHDYWHEDWPNACSEPLATPIYITARWNDGSWVSSGYLGPFPKPVLVCI